MVVAPDQGHAVVAAFVFLHLEGHAPLRDRNIAAIAGLGLLLGHVGRQIVFLAGLHAFGQFLDEFFGFLLGRERADGLGYAELLGWLLRIGSHENLGIDRCRR